jgi:hypothetical protein
MDDLQANTQQILQQAASHIVMACRGQQESPVSVTQL